MSIFDNAKWIWHKDYDKENVYLRFFDQAPRYKSGSIVKMYISVDTNYALYINGDLVEMGQYADFPFDKVYDEIDITSYLFADGEENPIHIDCWHQGTDSSTHRNEKAGLIYLFTVDGEVVCPSNEFISVAPLDYYDMGSDVEKVSVQLGYSFRYDSRRPLGETKRVEVVSKPKPTRKRPIEKLKLFDDEPASLLVNGSFMDRAQGTIGGRMQKAYLSHYETNVYRPIPNHEGYTLKADERADGVYFVVDTKQENTGYLSLDFTVPNDCLVLIGWGEHLNDLRVSTLVGERNFAAAFYAKKGRNKYFNPFLRLGMRYLQVFVYAEQTTVFYAGIKRAEYPLSCDVEFTCADNLHQKIYEVSKRTLLMCMHEHYEDCPWREQALYAMDSRNQMLCGYYAFKEFDFAKASMRLIAQSLRKDNFIELCAPARVDSSIPSFSTILSTMLLEYMQFSGDYSFSDEILPALLKISKEFISRMEKDTDLITFVEGSFFWNFYEWQVGLAGDNANQGILTYDAPLMSFVSISMRSMSEIYKLLGNEKEAAKYKKIHTRLNDSINKYFWSDKEQAYASFMKPDGELYHYAELTNALIVCCDAAQGDRLNTVLNKLAKNTLAGITLSHSIFKYDALMRDPEKYSKTVFDDVAGKWGYMLYNGATTFWEVMEGFAGFGNAGSLCHGWSAVPLYLYHRYAAELPADVTGIYNVRFTENKLPKKHF